MLKAIIIDDEENCCELLKIRLKKHQDNLEVCGVANSVSEGDALIRSIRPDVVFLDIQMPEGSGFDLLKRFPDAEFEIVFVTAYNEYAIRALKMSALDYLLKPVEPEELRLCVEKLVYKAQEHARAYSTNKLNILQSNTDSGKNDLLRLVVPLMNGFEVVNVSDIIYCKAESNYTRFFLPKNKEYLVSKTLKEFEEILSDLFFFRIHNSYLINLNHVKGYNKGKSGTVIMSDGTALGLSRQKKGEFLNMFLKG